MRIDARQMMLGATDPAKRYNDVRKQKSIL